MPSPNSYPRVVSLTSAIFLLLAQSCVQLSADGQSTGLKERPSDSGRIVLDVIASSPLTSATDVVVTDNDIQIAPNKVRILPTANGSEAPPQVLFVVDAVNGSRQDVARSEDAIQAVLKGAHGTLTQLTSVVVLTDAAAPTATAGVQTGNTAALRPRQLYAHRIPATKNAVHLSKALAEYAVGLNRILESQSGPGQAERVQLSLQASKLSGEGRSSTTRA